jgi:hypothetical protein
MRRGALARVNMTVNPDNENQAASNVEEKTLMKINSKSNCVVILFVIQFDFKFKII